MAKQPAKRGRGRPPGKRVIGRVKFTLPKDDFDYLTYLAVQKRRLGVTVHDAARSIVIREVHTMRKDEYHLKETPGD